MKNTFFLVLGFSIIFCSIFIFLARTSVKDGPVKVIKINNASIEVEVVDTPKAREKGLSGREKLQDNTGMLFIFDTPGDYGFWMKDMNFAIDMVWIDENYQIVDINKEVSPDTFPQVFYPDKEIRYVLELPVGAVDKYQIATSTMVQF